MAKKTKSQDAGGAAVLELPQSKPTQMLVESISISAITVDGTNARIASADEDAEIRSLAVSMADHGLQQPIRVVECERRENGQRIYRVVFGHRRLAAAKLLKWESIPATINNRSEDVLAERAIENVQRDELNPIERSIAVGELMDEAMAEVERSFGVADGKSPADARAADAIRKQAIEIVAREVGKTPAWVRDHVFLGTLDKVTRELVVAGRLPWEHARELAKVADIEKRAELARAHAINPSGWRYKEQPAPLSDLRAAVAPYLRSLAQAPWDLDLEFANAPACSRCPENSRNQTGLFEHHAPQYDRWKTGKEPEAGVCLNAACYGRKSGATNRSIANAARKVALTVSAAPKADRDKVRQVETKRLAPPMVKASAFAAAVKDKVESKADAKKSAPLTPVKRAETPESKAKRDFEEAHSKWLREVTRGVDEKLKAKPEVFHLLCCIDRCEPPKSKTDEERFLKVVDAVLDPQRTDAFDLICKLKLYKHAEVYWDSFDQEFQDKVVMLAASRLSVKPKKPEPKLEDFLPKPKAEKPAKGNAAGGKKDKSTKGTDRICSGCGDVIEGTGHADGKQIFCDTCWEDDE